MAVWNAIRVVVGIRSSVCALALPFRPLYSNISLLSFLIFLRDSHFNCPRMPVILPVSWLQLPLTNLATHFCTLFNSSWRTIHGGYSPQESKGSVSLSATIAYMCIPSQITCNRCIMISNVQRKVYICACALTDYTPKHTRQILQDNSWKKRSGLMYFCAICCWMAVQI